MVRAGRSTEARYGGEHSDVSQVVLHPLTDLPPRNDSWPPEPGDDRADVNDDHPARLPLLLDRLPDPVAVVQHGRLAATNLAWRRSVNLAGVDASLGSYLADLVHLDDRRAVETRLRRWELDAAQGHHPRTEAPREVRLLRGCVEPVVLELSVLGRTMHRGASAVVVCGRDLTELRIQRGRLTAAERLVSVGSMAMGVTHEINNVLQCVITNVQLASRELPEAVRGLDQGDPGHASLLGVLDGVAHELEDARNGATRVMAIVRDLKSFSRPRDDTRAEVYLERVADATIGLAWNEIRHHARVVKAYGPAPAVEANESRLGQVVLNLLINAAQAISPGAADLNTIRVGTSTDARGRAVLEVQDTGMGIPKELLGRIFDPFFTTKSDGLGTGLGLAICLRIVQEMGGDIEVESVLGRGALFRVVLPPAHRDGPIPTPVPAPVSTRRGRLLVVDDEPALVSALQRTLASAHEVHTATSGREALERLESLGGVDVILCDVMMPEMTGIELYEVLARKNPVDAAHMVFMTGGTFTPGARAFLDRVPNPRLEKPFDVDRVRAVVSDLLRG